MDHQIQRGELSSVRPSAVDLFDPALELVTDHRVADFAAGGDPEAWMPDLIRDEVQDGRRSVAPATGPVTEEIVGPPPELLRGGQALARPLLGAGHQTLRRLRPFERRREMTARPLRVRIRTRKP
jgi:hypothetical protein